MCLTRSHAACLRSAPLSATATLLSLFVLGGATLRPPPATAQDRQIVFLAGPKDHGRPGRHEYEKDLRALAWSLENASVIVINSSSDRHERETHPLFPQAPTTDYHTYDEATVAYLRELNAMIKERNVGVVKDWVDVARTLGAPSIRANAGSRALETAVQSLRELNDYAAERGILLLTENHGGISTYPDVLLQILNAIPGDNFRAVADFGNFPDGADRFQALARVIPHTHLIPAITQIFDEAGRHASSDFGRCVQTAEGAGFQGMYSAEQWDPSRDPLDAGYIADWMIEHIRANI